MKIGSWPKPWNLSQRKAVALSMMSSLLASKESASRSSLVKSRPLYWFSPGLTLNASSVDERVFTLS